MFVVYIFMVKSSSEQSLEIRVFEGIYKMFYKRWKDYVNHG